MAKKEKVLASDPTEGLDATNAVATETIVADENETVTEKAVEKVEEATETESTTEEVSEKVDDSKELVEVKGLELVNVSGKDHYKTEEGIYLPVAKVVVEGKKTFIPKWLHELKFGK